MLRRPSLPFVLLALASLGLLGCSSDEGSTASSGATTPGTGGAIGGQSCETGDWVSTGMDAPSQAGIGEVTPVGGGDGMNITLAADGVFQIDFGPMTPTTATFTSGGQAASLATTFSGVGKGTWSLDADGSGATGSFDDLTTVKATVTITLGETVPPVFDETLQQINDNRMLNGEKVGVFEITDCGDNTLTLTSPFPGGSVVIHAAHKG